MRRAKIICTIGPASSSKNTIYRMIRSGMNVARLNFSHGTHEEHKKAITLIRSGAEKYNSPVAVLQDLKGLKIRTGRMKGGGVLIKKGSSLSLTTKKVTGDDRRIQVAYPRLKRDLRPGSTVLIDDGLIKLKVTGRERSGWMTRVMEGGTLTEKKGVNFPGVNVSAATLTKKDTEDLSFGIKLGVDYIAVSFVRCRSDILRVKRWLKKNSSDIPVIAKIENRQALENFDGIMEAADGIMIARGDLGVEIPPEEVPLMQKRIIEKCNSALKPVITATQMLESMTEHTRPTRAEAADVANAVLDGTDALMLSGETAAGRYPLDALKMMDRIIRYTETHKVRPRSPDVRSKTFAQAIAEAACLSAEDVNAKTIAAFTRSGFTSLLVSKFRPGIPITGFTVSEGIRRRMNLYWGIIPHVLRFPENTDKMITESEKALLQKRIVRKGDPVVIIATSPFSLGGRTNLMKIHKAGIRR